MIKLPFTDGPRSDGNPEYEHMWCDDVGFDGETLTGKLINAPNWLTSVKVGDAVKVPFSHLTDWIMTANSVAHGAYTVNVMRAAMGGGERRAHDKAWGLDFGAPSQIRIEIDRSVKKQGFFSKLFGGKAESSKVVAKREGFHDHPMCVNMLEKFDEQLQGDPSLASSVDDRGWSLIHGEALAGNLGVIKLLVKHGADIHVKTPEGKDAATLARSIGWDEVAEYLSKGVGAQ
jgi:uncharacterized protein YegJ (DUF2314 family)